MPKTPDQIKPLSEDFVDGSWRNYTAFELAMWVHLLRKRASHRTDPEKAEKDRRDADNYNAMLEAMNNG